MSVTVPTKDVGDGKNVFIDVNYKWSLEEGNENYIKREMVIEDGL